MLLKNPNWCVIPYLGNAFTSIFQIADMAHLFGKKWMIHLFLKCFQWRLLARQSAMFPYTIFSLNETDISSFYTFPFSNDFFPVSTVPSFSDWRHFSKPTFTVRFWCEYDALLSFRDVWVFVPNFVTGNFIWSDGGDGLFVKLVRNDYVQFMFINEPQKHRLMTRCQRGVFPGLFLYVLPKTLY